MLVLTRKVNEVIRIGDDIELMVLGVSGIQVRLGVSAPKKISIHRQEVYERIQKEVEFQMKGTNKSKKLNTDC